MIAFLFALYPDIVRDQYDLSPHLLRMKSLAQALDGVRGRKDRSRIRGLIDEDSRKWLSMKGGSRSGVVESRGSRYKH